MGSRDLFHITKEEYETQFRAETYGTENPSIMDKHFWKHMVYIGDSAYSVRKDIMGDGLYGFDIDKPTPGWCFNRFGQSSTKLPDGRRVMIGGEHEDFYDPDFFVYNDVVVCSPGWQDHPDNITIYGYPKTVFLPTDFHSATYCPGYECIYIIGGLGYRSSPHKSDVQVYCLDLGDFGVSKVTTKGQIPKAPLSNHKAVFVSGGNKGTGSIRVIARAKSTDLRNNCPLSALSLPQHSSDDGGFGEDDSAEGGSGESSSSRRGVEGVGLDGEDGELPEDSRVDDLQVPPETSVAVLTEVNPNELQLDDEDNASDSSEEAKVVPTSIVEMVYSLDLDTLTWNFVNEDEFKGVAEQLVHNAK
ncbi:hypothetical protein B0O99DRAFT_286954 [Bisporella sp. PMI_857]|nr:hypothetical protein B0O99DRAFT_286954 [Bisporella sp. PMI_857]